MRLGEVGAENCGEGADFSKHHHNFIEILVVPRIIVSITVYPIDVFLPLFKTLL